MKKAWMVRPYPDGTTRRADEFRAQELVGLGWAGLCDLTGLTADGIRARLAEPPYSLSSLALGNAAATVGRFVLEMGRGDLVLMPDGQDIYFARITGDYAYQPDGLPEGESYPHRRAVEWLGSCQRQELSRPLRHALKDHRTTADLTAYLDEIEARAQGEAVAAPPPEGVEVQYPLRPDWPLSLRLPADLTADEAARLGAFFGSLYFRR